jgi:hypothetical protein
MIMCMTMYTLSIISVFFIFIVFLFHASNWSSCDKYLQKVIGVQSLVTNYVYCM